MSTTLFGQHEARLRYMLDHPGLYGLGPDDITAIRWALILAESIRAERAEMQAERRRYGSYEARIEEAVRELRRIKP